MKRFTLTATLLLGGCASAPHAAAVDAHLVSRVVPAYAPRHDDAIAIVQLADSANADDQALTALLTSELPRAGFRTVDHPENARWILQGHYLLLAAPPAADAQTPDAAPQTVEDAEADIRLNLYSVTEFINGERIAVWTSSYYGKPELYLQHPQALIRLLLQKFGSDFERDLRAADLDARDTEAR